METYSKTPDKRPEYQKVVIDGDTIEKRREQRAEQLEKYVHERPEQAAGLLNHVTQWTEETGARVVPASQSLYDLNADSKKLRDVTIQHDMGADLPPIVKRTPEQRIDSMVTRLKSAHPASVEPILKEIAGEYWRAGMPVAVEDLRRVAAHFLNQAERRRK